MSDEIEIQNSNDENAIERQQIIATSKSVDTFHKLRLDRLEILTDSELDDQFARTTELELVAYLTRAKIFQIKLARNAAAGYPKSERQIAIELAALKNLHFETLIKDLKVAGLFEKYNLDLPKNIYESVLPLEPRQQSLLLKSAHRDYKLGAFSNAAFKSRVRHFKKVAADKNSKAYEILHPVKATITDKALADLNNIKRGFKSVSGFKSNALENAIRRIRCEFDLAKKAKSPEKSWFVKSLLKATEKQTDQLADFNYQNLLKTETIENILNEVRAADMPGEIDQDLLVTLIVSLRARDMANRDARTGNDSKNKKKN